MEPYHAECYPRPDGTFVLLVSGDKDQMTDLAYLITQAVPGHRSKYRRLYEMMRNAFRSAGLKIPAIH